ncbi:MAG: phosphoenolpyruvate carboxylase [Alphaproteobacteria bacterium]|nr:phosphoenolpyruvate carboxylase [Alphaproteobacteria bacterium]
MVNAPSTLQQPGKRHAPAPSLLDIMKSDYRRYCGERSKNPFYSSVLRLSLSLGARLQDGKIDLDDIASAIRALGREGLVRRGEGLAAYLAPCERSDNLASIERLVRALAEREGRKATFDEFNEAVGKVYYGFVFTAHPTFTMTRNLTRALAGYAAMPAGRDNARRPVDELFASAEDPFTPPTLHDEAAFSLEAIDNLHHSLDALYQAAFKVAEENYPNRWTELRPRFFTIATWVGFDLDGRNDINWTATFAAKLMLQIRQIESVRDRITELVGCDSAQCEVFRPVLRRIERSLVPLRAHYAFFDSYDPASDPGHARLQRASRDLVASGEARMLTPQPLIDGIRLILEGSSDSGLQRNLMVLLARLENFGLSRAHVHFRINAAQIHNAIRKHVELSTHPADPRFRMTYMDRLLRKFRKSKAGNIHFGNILEEEASAIRLFMLMQQVIKHIDSYTPVRFLIAETESSFTVMAALYYAHRFGIADRVDICPLFETERALQRGSRIVEHLLEIPEFRDYVRSRGRLCLQTGYSDAGRYIGQTPAAGSIERLKERVHKLFTDYKMNDAALLFFDTHGESTGRGGHPDNMHARMAYVASPHFLADLHRDGISYIQESSFQGGDGYVFFMNSETSLAAITRILEFWLAPPMTETDRFYDDKPGVTEFLTIVKEFQDELMQSPDYGALLSAYGTNLMRLTGSRAAKRQYDYSKSEPKDSYAREYRAIPHNAILAQMGVLVNSFSGIGQAIRADPSFFESMMANSERFRNIMRLVLRAMSRSNPDTMKAYIDTLDPMLWLMREAWTNDPVHAQKYAAVAGVLEQLSPVTEMSRVFRRIYADFTAFSQTAGERLAEQEDEEVELACLHALRLCLIHQVFLLAMDIPHYSPQHDISRRQLLRHVFRLDIPLADHVLREIFPVHPDDDNPVDYGERSDYGNEEKETYAMEQERIFDPLLRLHALIQDVSAAVSHHVGFTG